MILEAVNYEAGYWQRKFNSALPSFWISLVCWTKIVMQINYFKAIAGILHALGNSLLKTAHETINVLDIQGHVAL